MPLITIPTGTVAEARDPDLIGGQVFQLEIALIPGEQGSQVHSVGSSFTKAQGIGPEIIIMLEAVGCPADTLEDVGKSWFISFQK